MEEDDAPLDEGEPTAAWEHPPVVDDPEEEPDELGSEQVEPAELTDGETDRFEELSAPPKLPDALFETEPDGDTEVHWHLREDLGIVEMANEALDSDAHAHVAATTLVETADGEWRWEIPPELVAGQDAGEVTGTALFSPGEPIYFRASEAMISGTTRRCYAVTPDSLDRLT